MPSLNIAKLNPLSAMAPSSSPGAKQASSTTGEKTTEATSAEGVERAPSLQERAALAFSENFRSPLKKLSKKQEAKAEAERIARERQRLDPLHLHMEVQKRKKERKRLQQDVAKHYQELLRKEHEQKYGVDMFTAFARKHGRSVESLGRGRGAGGGAGPGRGPTKIEDKALGERMKMIRQESRKLKLQLKTQFFDDDGEQVAYDLRVMHNPVMRSATASRKARRGFKVRSSDDADEDDGIDDEAGNIGIVHHFLDFLIEQRKNLQECFVLLDVNGSESITRCEFSDGLLRMKYGRSMHEIDALFALIDTEKTCEVTPAEFLRLQPYYDAREMKLQVHRFPSVATTSASGASRSNTASRGGRPKSTARRTGAVLPPLSTRS
mmetsp:Transcript_13536/g.33239  ORF Transcript_13536/g.33239 Transcript_13536/m.33239 type:complete len:380 (+) Transcript_13536:310-1449(+)